MKRKNKILYLISGNYEQHCYYRCHVFKHRICKYVKNYTTLLGSKDYEYAFVGTYHQREDIIKIMDIISMAKLSGDATELKDEA